MTNTYTVTAPLVLAQNAEGGRFEVYQGANVPPGQTDEWIEHHLTSGLIAAGDPTTEPATTSDGEVKKPNAVSGSRQAWFDYAVAQGLTAEGLGDSKRDQIRALFDEEVTDASTEAWTAYALAQGLTEDDLSGLNRDEIRTLVE